MGRSPISKERTVSRDSDLTDISKAPDRKTHQPVSSQRKDLGEACVAELGTNPKMTKHSCARILENQIECFKEYIVEDETNSPNRKQKFQHQITQKDAKIAELKVFALPASVT